MVVDLAASPQAALSTRLPEPDQPPRRPSPLLSTHLPPPYRCWRHGLACHSQVPQSYSSCQELHDCPPHQSGSTHCLASLENCCCHNSGTTGSTWLNLSACQHIAPCWESGGGQGDTHLLLELVYSTSHTLMAWLVISLDHGVLQILLELCVQLWVGSKSKASDCKAGFKPHHHPWGTDRTRRVTRWASTRPAWNK